jgi:hypothetical protein
MPPSTKHPNGTAHSRRKAYLAERVLAEVREDEIKAFAKHCIVVAKQLGLRLPRQDKDVSQVITRMRGQKGGAGHGWMLDIVEAGLSNWAAPKAATVEKHWDQPPELANKTDTTLVREESVPSDIEILADLVPKLERLQEQERFALINYLADRFGEFTTGR